MRECRAGVITLSTPVVEVDGRDRKVDVYNWHLANPGKTWPSLAYCGHYVAHDNNSHAMGLTLNLSRAVIDTYVGQGAHVIHYLPQPFRFLSHNPHGTRRTYRRPLRQAVDST